MKGILVNPRDDTLTEAIIQNHLTYMRLIGKTPYIKINETKEYIQLDFGLKCFSPQGIMYSNLNQNKADTLIEATSSYFEKFQLPFIWAIDPRSRPSDMSDRLLSNGFKFEGSYPSMAVDFNELIDERREVEGFRYEIVEDEETCRIFWDVWGDGYPMPKTFEDVLRNAFTHIGFKDVPFKLFLGYLDGKPVATAIQLLAVGVAGVHDITVLPSARGKGIGTEMTLIALRDAKSLGYRYGVLCATDLGIGIYRRLGFREYLKWDFYMKFNEYLETADNIH
jgi:ribosomal protein S18 acetylase RimI-like enzyme